ncbi:hypothetical protein I79_015671 [Cricetulus griseus]|uniref:Uncharacterized protein n=1 Tax=Cricetulus griseus TaxID=10029 RepID=G3HXE9_CRIGR|nr:hypothetical protein I79_015671 [Cricetulus griseus]
MPHIEEKKLFCYCNPLLLQRSNPYFKPSAESQLTTFKNDECVANLYVHPYQYPILQR